MKLDFVIVGGMKCGTTAVGEYFSKHPGVNFCNIIEGDYFSHNNFKVASLDEYFKVFFKDQPGLKGESSPTYSHPRNVPSTAKKLNENFPDIKVILIVRNPLKRIESHINHLKLGGYSFNDDVKMCLKEIPGIIENSKFGFMVDEYIQVFGKERFNVVKFEDVVSGVGLEQLCNYLDLDIFSKSLPPANKTDIRYVELPITKFYKKHWMRLRSLPGLSLIKKPLKNILEKTFSKRLNVKEKVLISNEIKQIISEALYEDTLVFKKHFGYSPFDLKK
jgi:hypothetical protein